MRSVVKFEEGGWLARKTEGSSAPGVEEAEASWAKPATATARRRLRGAMTSVKASEQCVAVDAEE